MAENPLELPEKDQIEYFNGIKGFKNQVIDFDFILRLKKPWEFAGFVESIKFVWPETDYAGLHATDPNWYEFGRYQTGVLEPELLQNFDDFFRLAHKLKDDQLLIPVCYYTKTPKGDSRFRDGWGDVDTNTRADLMFCVKGGLFDHWGQFLAVYIVEGIKPFDLDRNASLIEEIKKKAKTVGKLEQTDEEWKQEWTEERKKDKERDEAIERYFEEESARYAAESEEI